MRKPKLNEEIVRRIEDALDERKSDRRRDREEREPAPERRNRSRRCLLYTSDAADERSSVDLGGRRIIKKNKNRKLTSKDDNT